MGTLHPSISNKLVELDAICKKRHVKRMSAFGSVVSEQFGIDSDVDFLVEFDETLSLEEYADNFFDLADDIETLLNRHVDLVSSRSLSNPYFIRSIERSLTSVYG